MSSRRLFRVLRVLTHLESGPRCNAAELAKLFQVSRRTIFRDLALLRRAGVSLRFDDKEGAHHIAPHAAYGLRGMDRNELLTLSFAAHVSPVREVPGLAELVDDAISMLLRNEPEAIRVEINRLLAACSRTTPDARDAVDGGEHLRVIVEAISRRRQVRIVLGDGTPRHTTVAPYRLFADGTGWLLVGRSTVHRRMCRFALRDIERVELTDSAYTIPQGFRWRWPRKAPSRR